MVAVAVEEAGIVVVETGAMVATAIVTIPSIRDQITMAHNHTAITMVVQVTEEATMEAMAEADMAAAAAVDMVEEVEVGIHLNRIHTTCGLDTNPSHLLIPMEALEVMEDEVVMEAMEEIQLTHEAMPLAIILTILVLVADTTPLHLSKIAIAPTELAVMVVAVVMADTVVMAQPHPSPRQLTHPEEVHLIVAMSRVAEVEVGD